MNKRKLLLINPVNPVRIGLTINQSSCFPPLGLGYVAALTPENWEIELVDENWKPFAYKDADLVGITAFTASASRAYDIASVYHKRGIPVVMGGIHSSMRPKEAAEYVDTVIIGEAENIWPQLIGDFERGCLRPTYKGEPVDMARLPLPRRDLFSKKYMFATVQTSRGCPMDCDFCSVTAFNGRRYRRRPYEEVLNELETIKEKMIFFVDDNIIGYGKEERHQALALFKGMVERKMNKWWFCQASMNFADDEEVLYWAGRAGCKMVFLGLEAETEEALGEVNKYLNLKKSYQEVFHRIHKAGIAVLGAFIFGMDGDTREKLLKRTHYLINSDVDVMQTTVLTPLPGTKLYKRFKKKNRLLYIQYPGDWDRYDMTEVVFQPSQMKPEKLVFFVNQSNEKMYKLSVILKKSLQTLIRTRSLSAMVFALQSNINYRNVDRNIKLINK